MDRISRFSPPENTNYPLKTLQLNYDFPTTPPKTQKIVAKIVGGERGGGGGGGGRHYMGYMGRHYIFLLTW